MLGMATQEKDGREGEQIGADISGGNMRDHNGEWRQSEKGHGGIRPSGCREYDACRDGHKPEADHAIDDPKHVHHIVK